MQRDQLIRAFARVRARTEQLAAPLSAEDQGIQSMPSCSPTKWHRAHTTWFFEVMLLEPRGVAPFDARYGSIFNSYYVALGPRHARPKRGLLSRPSCEEIDSYRRAVDGRVLSLLAEATPDLLAQIAPTIVLGLAHEEQHQELLLTDILNAFSESPLKPAYRAAPKRASAPMASTSLEYCNFDGGLVEIGAAQSGSFRFDNEEPRHRVYLAPFALANRPLTFSDWREFADGGGYSTPALWLSDGWDWVMREGVSAPGYARRDGNSLIVFGLDGEREALNDEPLSHISFYEADAMARFFNARLPTEMEWEHASSQARLPISGNLLLDSIADSALKPLPASGPKSDANSPQQLFGDVWEWTQSAYSPYPGYRPPSGPASEYNGKFMINQLVLRGGSCFTPQDHIRPSYRNFWHPDTRFQMTGVRLARGGA